MLTEQNIIQLIASATIYGILTGTILGILWYVFKNR